MQKIVIAANTSWFIYNFFRASIVEFLHNGNQLHIIAPFDDNTKKLQSLGCHCHPIRLNRSGMNPICELSSLLQYLKLYRRLKPDVVLNFTPKVNIYSAMACRWLRITCINNVAGLGSIFIESGLKSHIGRFLLKRTQPHVDHIVFQNPDDHKVYLDNGYISQEKSSRVYGIGINLRNFRPVEAPDDGIVRFILVARMLITKGVYDFVDATKIVKQTLQETGNNETQYQFSLLGYVDKGNPQGLSLEELQRIHDDPDLPVEYLGSTHDVFSVVKDYDCIVLPSFYREGVPQCLIEACAMAKPIITTNNVGCKETVRNGHNGYLVKKRNPQDLADAMIKMIHLSHKERIKMGNKGRQRAKKYFCHLKISRHYMRLIHLLLKK